MDFDTYYRQLDRDARRKFAERAGTSPEYIEIHLLPRKKMPRKNKMESLAKASRGALSYEKVVEYFLLSPAA